MSVVTTEYGDGQSETIETVRTLTAVASQLDPHENTGQEHKDGRKDHHHRVNGNRMLCGCHTISIDT